MKARSAATLLLFTGIGLTAYMALAVRTDAHRVARGDRAAQRGCVVAGAGAAVVSEDRIARVPRQGHGCCSYRKQYTEPSREPTTTSPVGPMAGDESMGPSVAKDHTRVPSGARA